MVACRFVESTSLTSMDTVVSTSCSTGTVPGVTHWGII